MSPGSKPSIKLPKSDFYCCRSGGSRVDSVRGASLLRKGISPILPGRPTEMRMSPWAEIGLIPSPSGRNQRSREGCRVSAVLFFNDLPDGQSTLLLKAAAAAVIGTGTSTPGRVDNPKRNDAAVHTWEQALVDRDSAGAA